VIDQRLTRRGWLRAAALWLGGTANELARSRAGALATATRAGTLHIGVLLVDSDNDARALAVRRGVELGIDEASRTAALFGLTVSVSLEQARHGDTARAIEGLLVRPLSAIVGGTDAATCDALRTITVRREVIFFGLACGDGATSGNACDPLVFHIAPSAETRRRARSRRKPLAGASASDAVDLVLWHHTLSRFGGEQLNQRFQRRFGGEMDSLAWSGWVAMKILTESALRAHSTTPADIARYLVRSDARFDGHKGASLAFEPVTHELRQPLYVVARRQETANERVIAELPAEPESVQRPGATRRKCDAIGSGRRP
jgi:hypothetical protein